MFSVLQLWPLHCEVCVHCMGIVHMCNHSAAVQVVDMAGIEILVL